MLLRIKIISVNAYPRRPVQFKVRCIDNLQRPNIITLLVWRKHSSHLLNANWCILMLVGEKYWSLALINHNKSPLPHAIHKWNYISCQKKLDEVFDNTNATNLQHFNILTDFSLDCEKSNLSFLPMELLKSHHKDRVLVYNQKRNETKLLLPQKLLLLAKSLRLNAGHPSKIKLKR